MPENVTLTDDQLARLDAAAHTLLVDAIAAVPNGIAHAGCLAAFAGNPQARQAVVRQLEDATQAIADALPDSVIAALRASRERAGRYESLLRRYHERVTAADNLLTGIIASRGYLNEAMSELPHPTIGNEVSAALGEEEAT